MFDPNRFPPIKTMQGEDPEETAILRLMFESSEEYLRSFPWLGSITEARYGFGIGGIVGLFLFHVHLKDGSAEWLWVVEGDLPNAYFVVDKAQNAPQALSTYCQMMQDWIEAVRAGSGLEQVFPLDAPADPLQADALEEKIELLRSALIPQMPA